MGNVKCLGESPNCLWDMDGINGLEFEELIFNAASLQIKNGDYYSQGTTVISTPKSGDNGKDVIITSSVDLCDIFFQNFSKKNDDTFTIYFECKYTKGLRLRYERISTNINEAKYDNIRYYVLVTNSSVIPETYHKIKRELDPLGIEFRIVDQYILAKSLSVLELVDYPLPNSIKSFYAEYQTEKYIENGETLYDVYILFRNYKTEGCNVSLSLVSDENWVLSDEKRLDFIIMPYGAQFQKYTFKQSSVDGINELRLRVISDSEDNIVDLIKNDVTEIFVPEFIGVKHIEIKNNVRTIIKESDNFEVITLWGETGIGKSRIVTELQRDLYGQPYIFHVEKLKPQINSLLPLIKPVLEKEKFIAPNNAFTELPEIIKHCKHTIKNMVFVFDDFHYADDKIIEEIKSVSSMMMQAPLKIIILGRDDYSEGKTSYFQYIQWSLTEYKDKCFTVKPFEEQETLNFIRISFDGLPKLVENDLLKKSMNNPLFIVQYIEYLLDTDAVSLVHRNTVGIPNPEIFNAHCNIPESIFNLYEKRLNNLKSDTANEGAAEFLLILAAIGGDISSDILNAYYDDNDIIDNLEKRKFVRLEEGKRISFYHESIFIFYKNHLEKHAKIRKEIAQKILSEEAFEESGLSEYEKARLYYWASCPSKAREYFKRGIEEISKIDNVSNFNIDSTLYSYLYDIYSLHKTKSNIAVKALLARAYLSLHHFAPIVAVEDCKKILRIIEKSKTLHDNNIFKNDIGALYAHSLFNSGFLYESQMILEKLVSDFALRNDDFNHSSIFDAVDRLASVYIKRNCFGLAGNYNKWSMKIAEKAGDNSLMAIAHRTRSKLYFYQDHSECKNSLDFVSGLRGNNSSDRIHLSNQVSDYMYRMYYDDGCDWKETIYAAETIRKQAVDKSYDRVLIRSDIVRAACLLKMQDFKTARKIIQQGIDNSIKLGIPTYIWQYYNLQAIADKNLGYHDDQVRRLFETVYAYLDRQGLLDIGKRDFCYGNILALNNIAFFFSDISEKQFRKKISGIHYFNGPVANSISYIGTEFENVCATDQEYLKELYHKASKKELLLVEQPKSCRLLRDEKTGYFMPMS